VPLNPILNISHGDKYMQEEATSEELEAADEGPEPPVILSAAKNSV
jgi:hypothetical protein